MEENYISSSTDVYYSVKSHFERWIDRYNRITREIAHEEELENIEFNKYTSNSRNLFFIQYYQDELDEYYNYIEKTLLELRTQKR